MIGGETEFEIIKKARQNGYTNNKRIVEVNWNDRMVVCNKKERIRKLGFTRRKRQLRPEEMLSTARGIWSQDNDWSNDLTMS